MVSEKEGWSEGMKGRISEARRREKKKSHIFLSDLV